MTAEQVYDIHGLVALRVRATAAVFDEIDLHLSRFRVDCLDRSADVIIGPYEQAPASLRTTVVDDYEYGAGSYHRAAVRLWLNYQEPAHAYYMDRLHFPINLIVQLALMHAGLTFVHGAALVIDGEGVVFPAYPGTGKTTLVSAFVRAGARFLGDDLCIVGRGSVYGYPQALSVYPHHLPILGYSELSIERAFRRTALVDRLASPLLSSSTKLAKLGRLLLSAARTPAANIPPGHVFGSEAIASSACIDRVVVLERSGTVDELVVETIEPEVLGSQAAAILWHEWHASFHDLLLYDALAESGLGMMARFEQVGKLITQASAAAKCERIRIPATWDNSTLVREFPGFWSRRRA